MNAATTALYLEHNQRINKILTDAKFIVSQIIPFHTYEGQGEECTDPDVGFTIKLRCVETGFLRKQAEILLREYSYKLEFTLPKVLVVFSDGDEQEIAPKNGHTFGTGELRDLIGGGCKVPNLEKLEDGSIIAFDKYTRRLDRNLYAELLHPKDTIFGTAVVFEEGMF